MSLNSRQMPLFCPPPVAIHDNGNMSWNVSLGLGREVGLGCHGYKTMVEMDFSDSLYAFNAGAKLAQFSIDVFISTVNVINTIDLGGTARGQSRNDQRG